MKIEPVLIIGAGPAGLASAIQLKRYGITPRIFEKDAIGGLLRNANLVENYPGFPGGIAGRDLVRLIEKQFRELSLQVTEEEVLELDHRSGLFHARTDRAVYKARIALIASGTRPRAMTSPGTPSALQGKIFYEIVPLLDRRGLEIVILGAGDAAFDYALNLAKSNQVSILNRGAARRCLPLLWERARLDPAIHYYDNTTVLEIDPDGPERLRLECRQPEGRLILHPHALIAAFGRDPRLDFLAEGLRALSPQLEEEGRLYFIGDVANGIYRQTSIAVGNGVQAAMKVYQKLMEGSR
jgi:thioredoxin reductase